MIAIKIIDGASSSTKDAKGKMLQSLTSTNKLFIPAAMLEQWSLFRFQRVHRPIGSIALGEHFRSLRVKL